MSFDKLLKDKNMTVDELAELTGISRATLFNSRKDNFESISFCKVVKICKVLNCLPHDLIPGTFEKETELEEQEKLIAYTFIELPQFNDDEKKYMTDMLNGSIYNSNILPQQYLQVQVLDSEEYDGLGQKWGVDSSELSRKVRSLTAHQAYVIIKIIRGWWNKSDKDRDLDNIF
jgi:DNA-binding Xre family transcriptional regulator